MMPARSRIARFARYQIPLLAVVLLLSACQSAPAGRGMSEPAEAAPPLPDAPVHAIDPQRSEVRLLVYRAGPLARFGHDHVISGPVHGVVHAGETSERSGFRLRIDADELQVDLPAARREEGGNLATVLSDEARQATRANMLGEDVLDANAFPEILVESLILSGPRWNPAVRARITLHGTSRAIEFPAAVFFHEEQLVVIARFAIKQSDFGIQPFSALGGGLRVADRIDVRVRLTAVRD